MHTAEGTVELAVPQVRGSDEPFRPRVLDFLAGNCEVLEHLVAELYAQGLSTRDGEDAFKDATGELMISKSAVSAITDRLWEECMEFCARDLSGIDVHYILRRCDLRVAAPAGVKEGSSSRGALPATVARSSCT